MAVEILIFAGAIDGDLPLDPAVTSSANTYFAGMAAQMTSAGVKPATTDIQVMGLFKNDSSVDIASGPQVDDVVAPGNANASIIFGANKVALSQATAGDVFLFPPNGGGGVWAEGQEIYVTSTGKWDNQAAAGGDAPLGRVVKAPAAATDPLHVYQYPRGSAIT